MLDHRVLLGPQQRAVIRRHQHEHAGTGGMRLARTIGRDAGAEMAAGDDHRHAAGDVRQAQIKQQVALRVREHKLLRIVGENADAVNSLVDHAVEHAPLTLKIEVAGRAEGGRRDRKHAGPPRGYWGGHFNLPSRFG